MGDLIVPIVATMIKLTRWKFIIPIVRESFAPLTLDYFYTLCKHCFTSTYRLVGMLFRQ